MSISKEFESRDAIEQLGSLRNVIIVTMNAKEYKVLDVLGYGKYDLWDTKDKIEFKSVTAMRANNSADRGAKVTETDEERDYRVAFFNKYDFAMSKVMKATKDELKLFNDSFCSRMEYYLGNYGEDMDADQMTIGKFESISALDPITVKVSATLNVTGETEIPEKVTLYYNPDIETEDSIIARAALPGTAVVNYVDEEAFKRNVNEKKCVLYPPRFESLILEAKAKIQAAYPGKFKITWVKADEDMMGTKLQRAQAFVLLACECAIKGSMSFEGKNSINGGRVDTDKVKVSAYTCNRALKLGITDSILKVNYGYGTGICPMSYFSVDSLTALVRVHGADPTFITKMSTQSQSSRITENLLLCQGLAQMDIPAKTQNISGCMSAADINEISDAIKDKVIFKMPMMAACSLSPDYVGTRVNNLRNAIGSYIYARKVLKEGSLQPEYEKLLMSRADAENQNMASLRIGAKKLDLPAEEVKNSLLEAISRLFDSEEFFLSQNLKAFRTGSQIPTEEAKSLNMGGGSRANGMVSKRVGELLQKVGTNYSLETLSAGILLNKDPALVSPQDLSVVAAIPKGKYPDSRIRKSENESNVERRRKSKKNRD